MSAEKNIQNLVMNPADFAKLDGEHFGGDSSILHLQPNTAAGPLTYVSVRRGVELANGGKPVDIHEGRDEDKNVWRLPLAATFLKQVESAQLQPGDKFAILRVEDAIKQKGAGKGKPMAIYQIKVLSRAPRA